MTHTKTTRILSVLFFFLVASIPCKADHHRIEEKKKRFQQAQAAIEKNHARIERLLRKNHANKKAYDEHIMTLKRLRPKIIRLQKAYRDKELQYVQKNQEFQQALQAFNAISQTWRGQFAFLLSGLFPSLFPAWCACNQQVAEKEQTVFAIVSALNEDWEKIKRKVEEYHQRLYLLERVHKGMHDTAMKYNFAIRRKQALHIKWQKARRKLKEEINYQFMDFCKFQCDDVPFQQGQSLDGEDFNKALTCMVAFSRIDLNYTSFDPTDKSEVAYIKRNLKALPNTDPQISTRAYYKEIVWLSVVQKEISKNLKAFKKLKREMTPEKALRKCINHRPACFNFYTSHVFRYCNIENVELIQALSREYHQSPAESPAPYTPRKEGETARNSEHG